VELTADPLAVFKGPTSKGRRGRGGKGKLWGREAMGKGMGGKGRRGEGEREEEGGRETKELIHLTHFAFRTLAALQLHHYAQ